MPDSSAGSGPGSPEPHGGDPAPTRDDSAAESRRAVRQAVSVSLFESMLAMQIQEAAMWLQRQKDLNWGAFPLTGVFETTDGAVVLVGAFKANPLQDICKALDLPDTRKRLYDQAIDLKTATPEEFLEQLEAEHRIKPEVREARQMGFLT